MFKDGTSDNKTTITGDDITIAAKDKSKLALRAGGFSISKGASVGIGAAFALIYSHNDVKAYLGNYTSVNASSLQITAEKLRVDFSDYESSFGLDSLVTDSSNLTDEEREKADTGIIDIHKGADDRAIR